MVKNTAYESAEVLRQAIAKLCTEFESAHGVYVSELGIIAVDTTNIDSVFPELMRRVHIEIKAAPGAGIA